MSAAYAAVLTMAAAAAAMKDFTLTICCIPFLDAATHARPSVAERSKRCQEILKRFLTLTLNRVC
jgi:hypothetical protein